MPDQAIFEKMSEFRVPAGRCHLFGFRLSYTPSPPSHQFFRMITSVAERGGASGDKNFYYMPLMAEAVLRKALQEAAEG